MFQALTDAEMLRLTRQLERHKALTPGQAQPLRLRAHRRMLDALQGNPVPLMRYWQEMPMADRLDPQCVQRFIEIVEKDAAAAPGVASTGRAVNSLECGDDADWQVAPAGGYGCGGGPSVHGRKNS